MGNRISILSITPLDHDGNVRAFVTVKVDDITICDCRLVQEKGKRPYLSGPQKYEHGRWWPLVKMLPGLREQVQAVVLDSWEGSSKP